MTRRKIRQGAALIVALVALAAVTITLTIVTAQVVAQHKMVQARHHQLQADWFARAGVEWAAERLLKEPSAFSEEKADFAPDWTVHIVVEKGEAGVFNVTSEASLRNEAGLAMSRGTTASFRRTEKGERVMLERLFRKKAM